MVAQDAKAAASAGTSAKSQEAAAQAAHSREDAALSVRQRELTAQIAELQRQLNAARAEADEIAAKRSWAEEHFKSTMQKIKVRAGQENLRDRISIQCQGWSLVRIYWAGRTIMRAVCMQSGVPAQPAVPTSVIEQQLAVADGLAAALARPAPVSQRDQNALESSTLAADAPGVLASALQQLLDLSMRQLTEVGRGRMRPSQIQISLSWGTPNFVDRQHLVCATCSP